MSVLTVEQVTKSFGGHTVLDGADFRLAWGDRGGLVGANGAGKSTLLNVIVGRESADGGRVILARDTRVGYLTQEPELVPGQTVRAAALAGAESLAAMEAELRALERRLEHHGADEGDGASADDLLTRYGDVLARFEQAGGYDREHTAEATLTGLGLPKPTWDHQVEHLSGGQRVRLALARLLLDQPELLVCDEPTNHLDTDAVEWLEGRLGRWAGALLLCSHDRYLLDQVCNRTLELRGGRITEYAGGYTVYLQERQRREEAAKEAAERHAEEEARLQEQVLRLHAWRQYNSSQSRQKRLDRLRANRPEPPPPAARGPSIHLKVDSVGGRDVLWVQDLSKAFGSVRLFEPWTAEVHGRERIGIVGPNGAGKTTLLRILAGDELPSGGHLRWGRATRVGWLRQDIAQPGARPHDAGSAAPGDGPPVVQPVLDDARTVLEHVQAAAPDMTTGEARQRLAGFLFRGDAVRVPAGELSGGERVRLAICLLTLRRANVLLCDEPTNHLDIHAREAMEAALMSFPGTLLVVSHDRYLLGRITTRTWWMEDGRVRDVAGGYAAFLTERNAWRDEVAGAGPQPQSRERQPTAAEPVETRPRTRSGARSEADIARTESDIAEAEAALKALAGTLSDPATHRDPATAAEASRAYADAERRLQALYEAWEQAAESTGRV